MGGNFDRYSSIPPPFLKVGQSSSPVLSWNCTSLDPLPPGVGTVPTLTGFSPWMPSLALTYNLIQKEFWWWFRSSGLFCTCPWIQIVWVFCSYTLFQKVGDCNNIIWGGYWMILIFKYDTETPQSHTCLLDWLLKAYFILDIVNVINWLSHPIHGIKYQ